MLHKWEMVTHQVLTNNQVGYISKLSIQDLSAYPFLYLITKQNENLNMLNPNFPRENLVPLHQTIRIRIFHGKRIQTRKV